MRIPLVLLLVLAGCGRLPPPTYPIEDADEALRAQRLELDSLPAFRAEARVDQREGKRRIRGTVLMIVERPDRVRIDAMTRLGAAATLTSDGERFALLDLREERFFVGESCAENVARGLGVAVAPAELVRFLFGEAPSVRDGEATIEPTRGGYRIVIARGDGTRQIVELGLDREELGEPPSRQRPKLSSTTLYDAEGRRLLRARFAAHRDVRLGESSARMPHEIHVEEGRNGADILLRYKSIEPIGEAPEGAFEQATPPGLQPELLPCHP